MQGTISAEKHQKIVDSRLGWIPELVCHKREFATQAMEYPELGCTGL
jgi:hypothetical protein